MMVHTSLYYNNYEYHSVARKILVYISKNFDKPIKECISFWAQVNNYNTDKFSINIICDYKHEQNITIDDLIYMINKNELQKYINENLKKVYIINNIIKSDKLKDTFIINITKKE